MFRSIYSKLGQLTNRLPKRDQALLAAAVARGLNPGQVAVIQIYLSSELEVIQRTSFRNTRLVGLAVMINELLANAVTIVTGTGLELPGINSRELTFYLAASRSALAGMAAGLLLENKKQKSTDAMNGLRRELSQFVGESLEYRGLELDEAWPKFLGEIDRILEKYHSQDTISPKKPEGKGR